MAVTMELEESVSDSKLHKDSTSKKELRPSSALSVSKSEHGAILCTGIYIKHNIEIFIIISKDI